jgi:hypothetical protein
MTQHDLFWKGYTGEQLKKAALDKFELHETVWLSRARLAMCNLLSDGQREVSSDDVWRYCPPPADAHPSCMGSIFRQPCFITVGWIASTRPSAHARVIRTYRLRGDNE